MSSIPVAESKVAEMSEMGIEVLISFEKFIFESTSLLGDNLTYISAVLELSSL